MLTLIYLLGIYITFISILSYLSNSIYSKDYLNFELIVLLLLVSAVFPITWIVFIIINIYNSNWYKKTTSDITYDLRGETHYKLHTLKGKIISKEKL